MKPNCTFKTYFFLLMGLLFSQSVLSAPISRQKAQQNAQEFLQQKGIDMKQRTLRQAPMSAKNKMESASYINNDDGCVVAFGDERASTVIGYSPQGHLEKANVNVIEEMISIVQAQRAYEMNQKGVQAADEMARSASQLQK